jgi:hypothetical protein
MHHARTRRKQPRCRTRPLHRRRGKSPKLKRGVCWPERESNAQVAPGDLGAQGLRGYGPGHVVRRRQSETAFGEILGVSGQSLLDASRDLLASRAKRDDPRDVREVSPAGPNSNLARPWTT